MLFNPFTVLDLCLEKLYCEKVNVRNLSYVRMYVHTHTHAY